MLSQSIKERVDNRSSLADDSGFIAVIVTFSDNRWRHGPATISKQNERTFGLSLLILNG